MSEKFTPGPWQVEEENCHTGQVAVCHGDKETYFEVWTPNWENGIDQEANAHLIAAAPEMYEALRAVDAWENPSCFEKVKAALKKARGES